MNGISLFSGVDGLGEGLSRYVRTVCYVEWDGYAQGVLMSRIRDKSLDDAPIWDDVRTFDGKPYAGKVDIVFGGFPCQDISTAGKGAGIREGTRSGLWFQMLRVIDEVRPAYVFVENVSALTNHGLDIVLGCLSQAGYDAVWTDLRASDVGAPHRRERVFILAYAKPYGDSPSTESPALYEAQGEIRRECQGGFADRCSDVLGEDEPDADADIAAMPGNVEEALQRKRGEPQQPNGRTAEWRRSVSVFEPKLLRNLHGVSYGMDRIRCLGNAVVPRQAERAWEILMSAVLSKAKEGKT